VLRLRRPKASRSERAPQGGDSANPRLERLVTKARAILLFERAWRIILPPLLVLGFFICLSWAGIWLEAPHWVQGLGILALATGIILSLWPARNFRFPTRKDALERIDRVSALPTRPAAVIDDRLGNGGADPTTRALWNLHRRRAELAVASLQTGAPSPRMVDVDRYALRATILVGLVATSFIAGPEKYARLAAAFDWHFGALSGSESRLDAWIDPPAYTGKTPIVLSLKSNSGLYNLDTPQKIEAPIGSIVIIHAASGPPPIDIKGALAGVGKDATAQAGASAKAPGSKPSGGETRLILQGDAKLTLGHSGTQFGAFDIHAILDQPPSIAPTDAPVLNARGSLTLKYRVADDYGVIGAEANFAKPVLPGGRPAARSLVDPPKIALLLPPAPNLAGEAETTADLAEHPWAGARVEMTLSARDEGGNEGKSDPVEMTLPQKPFVKPLARALVEQRRNLVLAPDDKARVLTALDALMFAPETFDTSASVYLGLRVAFDQLSAAKDDSDLTDVAEYLWQMALRLENGNLSEAERELRAAEEHLREALQRNAPDEEIRKLAENLRAAMDKFLQELAAQQNDKEQENHSAELDGPGRSVNAKELQAMLDKMQDMLRSGDAESAQKMLEQLQNILENLRVARPRKADPRAQQMTRALDELGRMSQDQQDLRDETYQGNQANRHQQRVQRNPWGQPGQQTFGDFFNHEDGDEDADVGNMDSGDPRGLKDPPAQRQSQADLGKRQRALRDRLETLQKKLDESGADPRNLDDAQKAMRQAESALGQGPRGGDDAVNAQGRAIDALREGAQKLAEAMRGEGEAADGENGEGSEGQGGMGRFGSGDATDPLGRPGGSQRAFNPGARYDPMGVPAAERARRVLEELRRRLGEPARPREEMDYLERLLRRY
jgi:uncharacterized protein (TIGR02302 family)